MADGTAGRSLKIRRRKIFFDKSYSGRGDPGGVSKTVVRFRIGAAADSNSSGRWTMTLRARNQISRGGAVAILDKFFKIVNWSVSKQVSKTIDPSVISHVKHSPSKLL